MGQREDGGGFGMSPGDADLLRRLQAGQVEALGLLYDRHRQRVYRTALAVTMDPEVAADVLQETFLRLHRFADRVDAGRPLEPWLYRVTVNLAYSEMKRRRRWLRFLEEMKARLVGEHWPGPQKLIEQDEEVRRVREAVASLPLAQRVVVVLYYLNELSLQEIAHVLEVPEGTVKSRLHYARRALRQKLVQPEQLASEAVYEFS